MAETKVIGARLDPNLVKATIYKLELYRYSSTVVRILSGAIVGSSDGSDLILVGSNVDISSAVSGVGGLDTGTMTSNEWYYIWLVKNKTTEVVSGVISLSYTAPTISADYIYRRVGAIRYETSSFRNMSQIGDRVTVRDSDKELVYTGSPSKRTYYSISLGSKVAETFKTVTIEGAMEGDDAGLWIHWNNTDSLPTSDYSGSVMPSVNGTLLLEVMTNGSHDCSSTNTVPNFPLSSRTLYWWANRYGGSGGIDKLSIGLIGYTDSL